MNIIGIDIGGTKMLMTAKVSGKLIEKQAATGFHFTKEQIKSEIDAFLSGLPEPCDGIGIAIPGLCRNGAVIVSNVMPGIAGMTTDFIGGGNFPVFFINDVKAAVIEEAAAFDQSAPVIVIMAGTGIGMGIRSGGMFLNGRSGWAGELGSIPINTPEGTRKLDEVASGAAIVRALEKSPPEIISLLEKGDRKALDAVRQAGEYFGLGLACVINLLNPAAVILGGGTLKYKGYLEAALKAAEQFSIPQLWRDCEIRTSENAKYIVAFGAARYAGELLNRSDKRPDIDK